MSLQIFTVKPTSGTLVEGQFDTDDYRDAFLVPTAGRYRDVGEFATFYFLHQPVWLSFVSMNLPSKQRLTKALGDASFQPGSTVGSWKVHARNDREIVFGDHMGFMEYRFSFLMTDDGDVEASTAVKYRWRRLSALYFTLVKPMHRKFVPISLKAALRDAAPIVGAVR